MSKDEPGEVHLEFKVTRVREDTTRRRLLRWMTQPARIIAGIPIALFLDWLNSSGHHMTQSQFWFAYVCWFPAIFIVFWLYELHARAGGRRLNG